MTTRLYGRAALDGAARNESMKIRRELFAMWTVK